MDKEQLNELKGENKKELKTQKALPKQELNPERELPAPSAWERILEIFRRLGTKRNLVIIGVILVLTVAVVAVKKIWFKAAPKELYQAAIMVRSQSNKDPLEDKKTSLKAGDVLSVQDAEHRWSKTESISYLILKMELTEEQKQKLTQAEEREIPEDEMSVEELQRIEEEKQRAREENREYEPEPRTETLRAREYFVDLAQKEFAGFKPLDLYNGQPFQEKVYDWRIVEKKKSVLKEK